MKKVGLLGGTFDPIHFGHLILAQNAKSVCGLDEVWFMPAKTPPHKLNNHVSGFYLRKDMVELAVENEDSFYCSDFENTLEGTSYTFNTLQKLIKKYNDKEFYFIMGADSFYEIETWKNPDIILSTVRLIIASRDYNNEHMSLKNQYEFLRTKYDIKAVYFINAMDIDISSSEIRELVRNGENINRYVPQNVCDYIKEKKLYV